MRTKTLSNKEMRAFFDSVSVYGAEFGKKDRVEQIEFEGKMIYRINGKPSFFKEGERMLPLLGLLLEKKLNIKDVIVDMGAVKFVTSGADIMRPGIVQWDPGLTKGELVAVRDVMHKKPLALGQMLLNDEELANQKKGRSVLNLHYIGDKIWKF